MCRGDGPGLGAPPPLVRPSQSESPSAGETDPDWVPEHYAGGGRGKWWFRAILAAYLFAPLPPVAQQVTIPGHVARPSLVTLLC